MIAQIQVTTYETREEVIRISEFSLIIREERILGLLRIPARCSRQGVRENLNLIQKKKGEIVEQNYLGNKTHTVEFYQKVKCCPPTQAIIRK